MIPKIKSLSKGMILILTNQRHDFNKQIHLCTWFYQRNEKNKKKVFSEYILGDEYSSHNKVRKTKNYPIPFPEF